MAQPWLRKNLHFYPLLANIPRRLMPSLMAQARWTLGPLGPDPFPAPGTSQAAIQHWKQKIAQNRQECEVMGLGSAKKWDLRIWKIWKNICLWSSCEQNEQNRKFEILWDFSHGHDFGQKSDPPETWSGHPVARETAAQRQDRNQQLRTEKDHIAKHFQDLVSGSE
jgi:hypothetical protein